MADENNMVNNDNRITDEELESINGGGFGWLTGYPKHRAFTHTKGSRVSKYNIQIGKRYVVCDGTLWYYGEALSGNYESDYYFKWSRTKAKFRILEKSTDDHSLNDVGDIELTDEIYEVLD